MAGILASLLEDYRLQKERHRNRPFLRATMAACSLAATADGEVSFSDRIRVDQILETLEALKIFDPHEAVDLFNEFAEGIFAHPRAGRERALAAVQAVARDDAETAELIIRICLAVAEAKGEKKLVDEIEIVMLCSLLGVEPKDTGLYSERGPENLLGDEG